MKSIILTQGKVAIVDDEDFDALNAHKWYAKKILRKNRTIWYATRHEPQPGCKPRQRTVLMHREVIGVSDSREVDHKNGEGLDNRKMNLRVATHSQNKQNSRKQVECSSRFKGVHWNINESKWQVRIQVNGQRVHLGYFDDEEIAAQVYDQAAKQEFGEYACTNSN